MTKPVFRDLAKVVFAIAEKSQEIAEMTLDDEQTAAYWAFKGMLEHIRESETA